MAHFKAFLYDTLVNVMASLLLDLLHLVVHLISSAPACVDFFASQLCAVS